MRQLIRQAVRFGLVGLINTGVGLLAIYAVLYFGRAGPVIANAIGYAIGLTVSFVLNRLWTFEDRSAIRRVLPRYLAAAGIAYFCNLAVVVVGTRYLHANPYAIQPLAIVIYTATMFFGCRRYVFGYWAMRDLDGKDAENNYE
jgi:putative flippase GtrA